MRIADLPVKSILRATALTMIAAGAAMSLHAQQAGLHSASAAQYPTLNFDPAAALQDAASSSADDITNTPTSSSSDSTSSSLAPAATDERDSLVNAFNASQPPPRRRYGRRPNFSDKSHNPDGSNKLAVIGGVGFTIPLGNAHTYLTTSYDFQVGAGLNFSKKFAILGEFNWNNFGFQGQTLANQSQLYFGAPTGYGLDGKSHIWSFSVDPVYNFYQGEKLGAYGTVGVGFYHKTANFTIPQQATGFDPFFGFYQYTANQTIDKYTSNAPGFDAGFGITYKFSRFANERFYAEARYVFVDSSQRQGITVANASVAPVGNNFYPANSNRTQFIPITFGIRF